MKKDATTDWQVIAPILDKAEVLWLALADENGPYCVPVNSARQGRTIYVHSGLKGRKATILRSGAPLGFSAAVDVHLKEAKGDNPCSMGYRFRSVCGTATPRELEGEERLNGLGVITRKYAGRDMDFDERALKVTTAFALDVSEATARTKE